MTISRYTPGMGIAKNYATRAVVQAGARALGRWIQSSRMNRSSGKSNNNNKRNAHELRPTSQYHEDQIWYRRRRAPKKLRRKARRFHKSYVVNKLKDLNPQVFKFSTAGTVTSGSAQTGFVAIPGIYTKGGSAHWQDLYQMTGGAAGCIEDNQNPGVSGGVTIPASILYFSSGTIELSLCNNGSSNASLYVYECRPRSSCSPVGNPGQLETTSNGYYALTGSGGSNESTTDQGMSLFDLPWFTSNIEILKVRKHYLTVGTSMDIMMRDPRDRRFDTKSIYSASSDMHWKGATRFYVVQVYGDIAHNGGAPAYTAASVDYVVHRTYFAKRVTTDLPTNTTANL